MVIRASAIILSDPRGIPAPLPALLTSLSYYISDRSLISPPSSLLLLVNSD